MTALGADLEVVLRTLVRQLIREELALTVQSTEPVEDDEIAQLAAEHAAKMRRARQGAKR